MNDDAAWMARALFVAERGRGRTTPNPLVGAVVVSPDGIVLGQGAHLVAGGPHAEVHALAAAGEAARGATLYCTLEPCCHVGRTGPCTEAVINAGITRVVTAIEDPNPRVAGGGHAVLRAAGIEVVTGIGRDRALLQNAPFFTWITHGRPWTVLKTAASADGFVSAGLKPLPYVHDVTHVGQGLQPRHDMTSVGQGIQPRHDVTHVGQGIQPRPDVTHVGQGLQPRHDMTSVGRGLQPRHNMTSVGRGLQPRRLTGPTTDRWMHRQRAWIDAIAVGADTALADNPLLTPRGAWRARPLTRVIIDWRGRVPPDMRVYSTRSAGPVIMVGLESVSGTHLDRLRRRGIIVELFPDRNLAAVVERLAQREVQSLLVEGGPVLQQAWIDAGLVDAVQYVETPLTLGAGTPVSPSLRAWVTKPSARHLTVLGTDRLLEGSWG